MLLSTFWNPFCDIFKVKAAPSVIPGQSETEHAVNDTLANQISDNTQVGPHKPSTSVTQVRLNQPSIQISNSTQIRPNQLSTHISDRTQVNPNQPGTGTTRMNPNQPSTQIPDSTQVKPNQPSTSTSQVRLSQPSTSITNKKGTTYKSVAACKCTLSRNKQYQKLRPNSLFTKQCLELLTTLADQNKV